MADPPSFHDPEVRFRTSTVSENASHNDEGDRSESSFQHIKGKLSPSPVPSVDGLQRTTPRQSRSSVYLGSYAQVATPASSSRASSPASGVGRHIPSVSKSKLEGLLSHPDPDLEDFGLEETRDGFFSATFYPPKPRRQDSARGAEEKNQHEGELSSWVSGLGGSILEVLRELRGRPGVKLFKSFFGVWAAYVVCLVPASRDWLGRYNFIIAISAIVNHAGRACGSQIDGAFMTCLGTVAGLGWGSLALYVSTSTMVAGRGYGGVLATFLVIFTAAIGYVRCLYMRFYQAVIAAGVSICYVCLANTSEEVGWRKVYDYGIPWALGQALCLVVNFIVFPSAGVRSLG